MLYNAISRDVRITPSVVYRSLDGPISGVTTTAAVKIAAIFLHYFEWLEQKTLLLFPMNFLSIFIFLFCGWINPFWPGDRIQYDSQPPTHADRHDLRNRDRFLLSIANCGQLHNTPRYDTIFNTQQYYNSR